MKTYLYSEYPVEAYYSGNEHDFIQTIAGSEGGASLWNMLWLSQPSIEKRRTKGTYHVPSGGFIEALYDDIYSDHALCRKLTLHPSVFLEWFLREDPTTWDLYNVGGGHLWVDTVTERAREAIDRLGGITSISNNVIHVNFRRKTA